MGDMGDEFRAWKEFWKERRSDNTSKSTDLLKRLNVNFESKNNGTHLIVGEYDFWPAGGIIINRKTKKRGRGVFSLMKKIGVNHE